ncbi:MAG: hypothetical protein P1V81_01095 [Planctomycetota bacterium]|nr:hypothetical protein [Planctomycetota bacterium]
MKSLRILTSAIASMLLASSAFADSSAFELTLNQPEFSPSEPIELHVAGTPGQFGFMLFDTVTGPVQITPDLTIDLGISANFFLLPLTIPATGAVTLPCGMDCALASLIESVGGSVSAQAVSLDPVTAELCTSNLVTMNVDSSFAYCSTCDECKGGVVELTLRYMGDSPALVEVYKEKEGQGGDETYFLGTVQPMESFTFVGVDDDQKLDKNTAIAVDGVEVNEIHTSCSKPIGPGTVFGDFRVLSAISKDNGPVCPVAPPGSVTDCSEGKPIQLEFTYTGNDCSASDNDQSSDKATCSGDPAGAASVHVLVFGKDGLIFDGDVALGGTFWADPTLFGQDKFPSNVDVEISDDQGNLLQALTFHASCSQPLAVGDVFGAIQLKTFIPKP